MNNINEIIKFLEKDLNIVNEIISSYCKSKSPLTSEIARHLINSGGKRIRPILLILCAKLFNENASIHNLAAAVELIHSATLLHDDVVDNSLVRRGKKTANSIWDNKASILVGDYVFSIAFQSMVKSNNIKAMELLAKTSTIMADGEVMQLENLNNLSVSFDQYIEIVNGKTAILFSSACSISSIYLNQGEKASNALASFGKNLGITFQMVDDILDYSANEVDIGKSLGDDFFESKVTLPLIQTYSLADSKDKKIIEDLLSQNLMNQENDKDNFKEILRIFNKYNSIKKSYEIANHYRNLAYNSLSDFKDSIYKNFLLDILNYSFERNK